MQSFHEERGSRRKDDRMGGLLLTSGSRAGARKRGGSSAVRHGSAPAADRGARLPQPPIAKESDSVLLMVPTGGESALRLALGTDAAQEWSADAEIPVETVGDVGEWQREWQRFWKRAQAADRLIAFHDVISLAQDPDEVCSAVVEHAVRLVGAHSAALFLPGRTGDRLGLAGAWSAGAMLSEDLELPWHPRFSRPGLIAGCDASPKAVAPFDCLAPLVSGSSISMLAHVPFGKGGVLILTERRSERIFEAEDWEMLEAIARQGSAALHRLWELARARSLSLTDPLTGLANRREMEVVLKHAWAGAERGEGLALLMLDLDGFKEVNDRSGHAAGDDLLRIVSDILSREARGADAVIRYGGDEFLVVLPHSDASGARSLLERVRKRVAGWIGISAGIAAYSSHIQSVGQLLRMADESLYADKTGARLRPRIQSMSTCRTS